MKLDTKAMRHLTADDWRVLTAVETGSRNHELVPTPLIERIARLRGGASRVHRSISALAKAGLVGRTKDARYDGYRLTYGGLDYLALHTHASRGHVYSVGDRVGVGKESDIVLVAQPGTGRQRVLKIHRLGRVSFRAVRNTRDYLRRGPRAGTPGTSWMYLSRLAAAREFAFLAALHAEGFPVPAPLAQSRHTVLMALVDAPPLRQVSAVPDPPALYADLMALIMRLARHGLIHGDFNEFNLLLKEGPLEEEEEEEKKEKVGEVSPSENVSSDDSTSLSAPQQQRLQDQDQPNPTLTPVLIDFPQMLSMDHPNAEMYFERDVQCVKTFFERRFHFVSSEPGPFFKDAKKMVGKGGAKRLDATVEVSGFTKKMARDLEAAIREGGLGGPDDSEEDGSGGEEEEEEEEGEEGEEKYSEDDGHDGDENEQGGVRLSGQAGSGSFFVPVLGEAGIEATSDSIGGLSISNGTA